MIHGDGSRVLGNIGNLVWYTDGFKAMELTGAGVNGQIGGETLVYLGTIWQFPGRDLGNV